jgi:hypothetical protein
MNSIKIIIGGFMVVGLIAGGGAIAAEKGAVTVDVAGATQSANSGANLGVNYLCYCNDAGGDITWRSRPLAPDHSADCKNQWVAAGGNPGACPDKNPWP